MRELIIIAAAGTNNALGKDNKLLWHLPDDFKHFKASTMGCPMIMGRKTYESLPGPLPNRCHIVISRNESYCLDNDDCVLAHSIDKALELCKDAKKVFIIGGGELYKQSMNQATQILLTRVNNEFEADAFFPTIDESIWKKTESIHHPKDDRHAFDFSIETYKRR